MNWIRVTLKDDKSTIVNLDKILQVNSYRGGSQLIFDIGITNKQGHVVPRKLAIKEPPEAMAKFLKARDVPL